MGALWIAPPAVLIAGSVAVGIQLRRIGAQRSLVVDASRQLEADRSSLRRLNQATKKARASLEDLEHR